MENVVSIDAEHCTLNGWMLDIPKLQHWLGTYDEFAGHKHQARRAVRLLQQEVRALSEEGSFKGGLFGVLWFLANLTYHLHIPDEPFKLKTPSHREGIFKRYTFQDKTNVSCISPEILHKYNGEWYEIKEVTE